MYDIAYPNLRAEFGRKSLTVSGIAQDMNITRARMTRMLSGETRMPIATASEIQRRYFPDLTLEYLFSEEGAEDVPLPEGKTDKPVEKIAYSVTEAAEAIGVGRSTMYEYINRADFPAFKVGGRVYVDVAGLREWSSRMAQTRAGY